MKELRRYAVNGLEGLGLVLLLLLVSIGTFRAWSFEGRDFSVFHAAFLCVTEGRSLEIFRDGPDRYLYAPGFAFFFSPFGLLSEKTGLLLFSILKIGALVHLLVTLRERQLRPISLGILAWGALLTGRSLLVDFTYGQVNFFVAWAAFQALWLHLGDHKNRTLGFLSWFVASVAAASKLLALPILLVPWLRRGRPVAAWERAGTGVGVGSLIALPFLAEGWNAGVLLHQQWLKALQGRGFPLETHNQSIPAFIHRVLGESPSPYIAMEHAFDFSLRWISDAQAQVLSGLAVLAAAALVLGWVAYPLIRKDLLWRPAQSALWAALLIGLLILPSHLVWKPYFVFGVGLSAILMPWVLEKRERLLAWIPVFLFSNFTTYEFVGRPAAAYFEAFCSMMMAHTLLLGLGFIALRDRLKGPSSRAKRA